MSEHYKHFANFADYTQYINGKHAVLPNISICDTEKESEVYIKNYKYIEPVGPDFEKGTIRLKYQAKQYPSTITGTEGSLSVTMTYQTQYVLKIEDYFDEAEHGNVWGVSDVLFGALYSLEQNGMVMFYFFTDEYLLDPNYSKATVDMGIMMCDTTLSAPPENYIYSENDEHKIGVMNTSMPVEMLTKSELTIQPTSLFLSEYLNLLGIQLSDIIDKITIDGKPVDIVSLTTSKTMFPITEYTEMPGEKTEINYYKYTFSTTSVHTVDLFLNDSFYDMQEEIEINFFMFWFCNDLVSFEATDRFSSFLMLTFKGAINLQEVIIPNGIELCTIGAGTFSECYSLNSLSIPDSVEEISGNAFTTTINRIEELTVADETYTIPSHKYQMDIELATGEFRVLLITPFYFPYD